MCRGRITISARQHSPTHSSLFADKRCMPLSSNLVQMIDKSLWKGCEPSQHDSTVPVKAHANRFSTAVLFSTQFQMWPGKVLQFLLASPNSDWRQLINYGSLYIKNHFYQVFFFLINCINISKLHWGWIFQWAAIFKICNFLFISWMLQHFHHFTLVPDMLHIIVLHGYNESLWTFCQIHPCSQIIFQYEFQYDCIFGVVW